MHLVIIDSILYMYCGCVGGAFVSLFLISLSVGLVSCSYVDTSEAIWFRSADPLSYFGYSVNLYRNRNKPSMKYVLIGAPRANSSSELFQTGNTFRWL